MKIRTKLIIAFITPILLIGLLSLAGFIWNRIAFAESANISANKVRATINLKVYKNELSRYSFVYAKYYNFEDKNKFDEALILADSLLDKYKALPLSIQERKYFDEMLVKFQQSVLLEKKQFDLSDERLKAIRDQRALLRTSTRPLLHKWQDALPDNDPRKNLLYKMEIKANKLSSNVRYYLIDDSDPYIISEIKEASSDLLNTLKELQKADATPEEAAWRTQLTNDINYFVKNAESDVQMEIKMNEILREDNILSNQVNNLLDNNLHAAAIIQSQEIQNMIVKINQWIVLLLGGLIIVAIVLSITFTNYLLRPINYLQSIIGRLRVGEDVDIKRMSEDEVGDLSDAFSHLVKENKAHAYLLSEQNWLKEHVSDILKTAQVETSIEKMCNIVITKLSTLLEAGCGAFYIKFEDTEGVQVLNLIGSYGYVKGQKISQTFKLGESLVGQAALTCKIIILSSIPDDYIRITSGLGEAKPRNIIVLPIILEVSTLGVIELALFKEITPIQLQFLEQLSNNLAVVIEAIQSRTQTESALSKVQEFSHELQVQQEELRATNEELEEKTHILQQSEEELKTQSEELQASNEELEEKMNSIQKQKYEIERTNAELEKTREELEHKATALARAGKYKTEFLSNMSHELRTPLNSLLLLSKSFANNADGNLTDDQIEQANIIYNGGKDLLQLINDILDLSKVEAGKLNIQFEEANIADITEDLRRQFESIVSEKSLKFEIKKNVMISSIYTDAYRLKQVIRNLISNAIKFTKEGSITLEVTQPKKSIKLQNKITDDYITFKVIDTGIGIEKSKFNDIFEAFQQAYGDTDRMYGGTGLGLTISKELAKLLGGEITLESKVGVGSEFSFTIPIKISPSNKIETPIPIESTIDKNETKNSAQSPDDRHQIQNETNNLTQSPDDRDQIQIEDKCILLIENNQQLIDKLSSITRKKGYKCLVAHDAEMGFELAKKYRPDGIILSLSEDDTDRMNVLRELKENESTKYIPMHVITNKELNALPQHFKSVNIIKYPMDFNKVDDLFKHFEKYKIDKNIKILLVEDDLATQKAILDAVKNKRIDIVSAMTGREAINKLQTMVFDGIILDLKLPDMDGVDILKNVSSKIDNLPPVIIHSVKDLSEKEYAELNQYTTKIVHKEGDMSLARLLNECSLFLHSVNNNKQKNESEIKMLSGSDTLLHGKEILIVDDDMRNVYALSMLLKRAGLHITVATNGKEALEKLQTMPHVDIIIMDIMMPVMDGYEAMRRIRKMPQFSSLPIIAVTAKAMPDDKKSCIDAGANDYITKPIDDDKLLVMLKIWLSCSERTP